MPSIPTWLKIPGNCSVVITGQTVDAAGLLADGTSPAAQTVTGSLVSIEEMIQKDMSEASPITTGRINNVSDAVNNGYTIGVLVNGSGVINPLKTLGDTYDIFKVVIVAKKTGATTTPTNGRMTYYGEWASIRTPIDSRNRIVSVVDLMQVDIGSANPVYD